MGLRLKKCITLLCVISFIFICYAQNQDSLSSISSINWLNPDFSSKVLIDIKKSGIKLPSGRNTALNSLVLNTPLLIKDAILSIPVDSSSNLSDIVLMDEITLEQLTDIIEDGKHNSGVFLNDKNAFSLDHKLSINSISSLLIKHHQPYKPKTPIDMVSSREYTGIIIDARGVLDVQGEFVKDHGKPCLFPKIWDETMELIYEKNMTDSTYAHTKGIVTYAYANDESTYKERIGDDPLRISARKIFGVYRTDPVISRNDALKILSVQHNLDLLKQGKVVILLDYDSLVYEVQPKTHEDSYYVTYRQIKKYYVDKNENVVVKPTLNGTQIIINDINFYPDSPEILPKENERIDELSEILLEVTSKNEFTILVEGHTASIGQPENELNLSYDRAQTIISMLIDRGINKDIFTFKGYGGTKPIADNSTPDGRAQNRRVEITVIPKATYIKRN